MIIDLKQLLEARLSIHEQIAKQGLIPGQLDSTELIELKGRIKELKFFIQLLCAHEISLIIQD